MPEILRQRFFSYRMDPALSQAATPWRPHGETKSFPMMFQKAHIPGVTVRSSRGAGQLCFSPTAIVCTPSWLSQPTAEQPEHSGLLRSLDSTASLLSSFPVISSLLSPLYPIGQVSKHRLQRTASFLRTQAENPFSPKQHFFTISTSV